MSVERKLLKIFGAGVLTPGTDGMKGAMHRAEELAREYKIRLSHSNSAIRRTRRHRRTTAEEIWRDTGGKVDILVAAVGTGGTFNGIADVLKRIRNSGQSPSNRRLRR